MKMIAFHKETFVYISSTKVSKDVIEITLCRKHLCCGSEVTVSNWKAKF